MFVFCSAVKAFPEAAVRPGGATKTRSHAFPPCKQQEIAMKLPFIVPALAIAALVSGCESYSGGGPGYDGPGYGPGPGSEENWDAPHYYRDGDYQERVMSRDDQVYYGSDGRYYCRRPDGTAGLIIGGIAGGVVGNAIAPGGSRTLGTLLGAAGGAAIGDAVATNSTRCR
jgi:hypothetical protein